MKPPAAVQPDAAKVEARGAPVPRRAADIRADAIVAGGGMSGLAMGLALARAGLSVAVVERAPLDRLVDRGFDGRTSAIAHASVRLLTGIGLWDRIAADAQPILDIRVVDGKVGQAPSPLFLHYDHRQVGDAPFGYIVENRTIRCGLIAAATDEANLRLLAPAAIASVHRGPGEVEADLDDGRRVAATVAIAADGRGSALRADAGIRVFRRPYRQTSIVCTVAHECEHDGVAVELFLPGGPFAMLPMTGRRTSIVWTDDARRAADCMALADDAFLEEVARRFGDWLGELRLVGPRFSYPLELAQAERLVDRRLALVGDAGHVIHPVAGQGLNLGLRDVAALAEVLVDAHRLGLDIGSAPVLQRYQRWRRVDTVVMAAVTDGLTRLFSNDVPPLRMARDLGLAAVNRLPPVKRALMRHAMGVVGDLPRLLRGQAL